MSGQIRDLRNPSPGSSMGPPKLEFPCDYALKVVGDAADDFGEAVARVIEQFDPTFDVSTMKLVASRNGRYLSARLSIYATGEEQIKSLFDALKATGRVHMVV
ncbi:YbeD family protein [Halomonas halocynthiae]|uniref:HP0495 family protein n=1 Tax=Halomonas halocynthiae TaxID=176290 RepID=UPI0004801C2F|nr:DUF493 domain-containing protein [Halomonas halocynthiae]